MVGGYGDEKLQPPVTGIMRDSCHCGGDGLRRNSPAANTASNRPCRSRYNGVILPDYLASEDSQAQYSLYAGNEHNGLSFCGSRFGNGASRHAFCLVTVWGARKGATTGNTLEYL